MALLPANIPTAFAADSPVTVANASESSAASVPSAIAAAPDAVTTEALENAEIEPTLPSNEPMPQTEEPIAPYAVPQGAGPAVEINGVRQKSRGDLHWVIAAEAGARYDDNIFISHSDRQSDVIFSLTPSITLGWGDLHDELRRLGMAGPISLAADSDYETRSYFFLHYAPTGTLFVDHSSQNTVDHDASLIAQWKKAYLTIDASSSFVSRSDPEIDVGTRVKRYYYGEDLKLTYDYSDRTFLEADFNATFNRYDIGLDSNEYYNQDWLNYRYGARTTLGVGTRFGYLDVLHGAEQYYEQGLVRAEYSITQKLAATANGGVEYRQVRGGKDSTDPVFGLGLRFQPFDQTYLSLDASRSTENSASINGDNITASEVSATVRQRFLRRYYAQCDASFVNAEYKDTGVLSSFSRTDNVVSISPSLRMDVTKAVDLKGGYSFRSNDSTVSHYSFSENQFYIQLDILF